MNLSPAEIGTAAIAIVAVLGLFSIVWKAFKRVAKLITLAEMYGPVLLGIGKQFETNSGASLKDQIDRIEKIAKDAGTVAKEAHNTATLAKEAIIRVEGIVMGRTIRGGPIAPTEPIQ